MRRWAAKRVHEQAAAPCCGHQRTGLTCPGPVAAGYSRSRGPRMYFRYTFYLPPMSPPRHALPVAGDLSVDDYRRLF